MQVLLVIRQLGVNGLPEARGTVLVHRGQRLYSQVLEL